MRWKVIGIGVLATALTAPGQTIGVSVFVDWLIDDLSLGRSEVSAAYLVGTLAGAAALPAIGRALDRWSVPLVMTFIGLGFGLGVAFVSRAWGLVALTVGFVLIRMLGQGGLTLSAVVAVTKWISSSRGAALGAMSTLGGALLGAMPLTLNALIEWTDWRTAWLLAGVVVAGAVPILAWLLARTPREPPDERTSVPDTSRAGAVRTFRFWVLAAATGVAGMLVTALSFHQISLLGEAGLSPSAAAAMFVPQVMGTAAAGYSFGWLADRWPARVLVPLSMLALAGALLLTLVLEPGPVILAYSVLLGVTGGSLRAVGAAVPPRWFGVGSIGAIQGVLTFVGVFGSALGPLVVAAGRDAFGDYQTVAAWSAAAPLLIAVIAATLSETRRTVRPAI